MADELLRPPTHAQNGRVRVQVLSDLHCEFLLGFPDWSGVPANRAADILVLAGDVGAVEDVARRFGHWPVPVTWVLGNHEFYREEIADVRESARQLTRKTSVILLDNDVLSANDLRLLAPMPI